MRPPVRTRLYSARSLGYVMAKSKGMYLGGAAWHETRRNINERWWHPAFREPPAVTPTVVVFGEGLICYQARPNTKLGSSSFSLVEGQGI